MKKILLLLFIAALAFFVTGCGKSGKNVSKASIIGKWKVAIASVNGNSEEPVFTTTYLFRNDNTCTLTTFGTNMEINYNWVIEPKTDKISLTVPSLNLTKTYTYSLLDKDTLLLVDSEGNTNLLTRMKLENNKNLKNQDSESNRKAFIKELRVRLDDWNNSITRLEKKGEKFSGKVKADYVRELDRLRRQREEFRQKLDQLQQSADNSWENFKKDLEVSGMNIQKDISNALSKFN